MPKPAKRSRSRGTPKQGAGILVIAGLVIVGVVITLALNQRPTAPSPSPPSAAVNPSTTDARPTVAGASTPTSAPLQTAPSQMEVKQAIMVTVELDFGPQIP